MIRLVLIAFISGMFWFPAPASSQEEELEMEIFFAPAETITSAARHAQPLELSPSAVTVLTREDIEASDARTLPEILRLENEGGKFP